MRCFAEASNNADEAVRPSMLSMALQWASLAEQAEKNAELVSELNDKLDTPENPDPEKPAK